MFLNPKGAIHIHVSTLQGLLSDFHFTATPPYPWAVIIHLRLCAVCHDGLRQWSLGTEESGFEMTHIILFINKLAKQNQFVLQFIVSILTYHMVFTGLLYG